MTTTLRALLVVGLSLLPMACRVWTDDPQRPEVFTERLVEAIRSKSLERRMALVHAKSIACWTTPQTGPFFDDMMSRQLGFTIPARYSSQVAPIGPDEPLMFPGQLDYPLRPTRQIQIQFDTGRNATMTMLLTVVHDAGRWLEVLPCPRPEVVAKMQTTKAENAKQEQRAQSLAAQLAEPERTELVRMAREGRRIEAMKKYASTSGETLSVAKRVVELLVPDEQ